MSAITQIKVNIRTGDRDGAGTDGNVYLGICGREFNIDRASVNDFEKGNSADYFLGTGSNVSQAAFNDPKSPQLDTVDADRYPVYIRFEPAGDFPDWNLESATVTITPGGVQFQRLAGTDNLWLGQAMGKTCYLRKL
jgi:hypothetical protein